MNTGPQAALLRGVETTIRAYLSETTPDANIPSASVGLTDPEGKPPPGAWTTFYGVCGASISGKSRQAHRQEREFGCKVVITRRIQAIPDDRIGYDVMAKDRVGLHDIVDAIAKLIHGNYLAVLNNANALLDLGDPNAQGLHKPLMFIDATDPVKKGGKWFGTNEKSDQALGYAVTLRFDGASFQQGVQQ